jgi:trk system potassium uptake protein TrkH
MATYVDWRQSIALTGTVIKYLAVAMLVPLVTSLVYGEDTLVFLASMAIAITIGLALEQLSDEPDLGPQEAMLFVAVAWLGAACIGAVPYLIAGYGTESTLAPSETFAMNQEFFGALGAAVVNALFESMSGFTTTGATVMGSISTEDHSHALMIWRQLTQWLGGMGIIVLMIAILPEIAVNGAQLMEREAPGPELQKLTPRIAETARVLWLVYLGFTVLFALVMTALHYSGFAPDMDLYNAIAHGFSTLPTGGFSPQADSIGAFGPAVQWLVIPFMIVAGTNFALFYYLLNRDLTPILSDPEFRTYIGAIASLTLVLAALLYVGAAPALRLGGVTDGNLENAARQAAFQIGSLMNSTGFATSDFAQWNTAAQVLLLFAMFIGGCAGSTGGGVKVVRWIIVVKVAKRELDTAAHPDTVQPIRLGDFVVDEDVIRPILGFSLLYLALLTIGAVVIAIDASRTADIQLSGIDALSASLATIGNIGPGFGDLGPFGSYLQFPTPSKLLMIFFMWIGRLEVIPVLAIFTGAFWRR